MSISSALNSAASGLRANTRLLDTVSNNVANALTAGYAKRTTELSSLVFNGVGGGVKAVGTTRAENVYLTAERRVADASLAGSSLHGQTYGRMMNLIGVSADDPNSLMAQVDDLEAALINVSASPDNTAAISNVVDTAKSLVSKLNTISQDNNAIRTETEREIAAQVSNVNKSLHQIDDLNRKIATMKTQGGDIASLEDERARLIDGISSIIPISTVRRDNDKIAIYSANGGVLLSNEVYALSFTPRNGGVSEEMSLGSPLSYLMQDQGAASGPINVAAGAGAGLFDGGSLGALFEVRDTLVPDYQSEIDAYATDLVDRFRGLMPAGALDALGEGMFVDAGGGTAGAAGRIEVNAVVDSAKGGQAWRIRDGLTAATQGDKGFTDYLIAMSDAMAQARAPAGFAHQSSNADSSSMASGIAAYFGSMQDRADMNTSYLTSLQTALADREIGETGVDSDTELSSLMVLENAYAANARVLSAIDELMRVILEI
jgi:flagellar hook-associated protein 1